jgi:hypothetical protein
MMHEPLVCVVNDRDPMQVDRWGMVDRVEMLSRRKAKGVGDGEGGRQGEGALHHAERPAR